LVVAEAEPLRQYESPTYGHLVRDADDQDRGLLDAYDALRARRGHDNDDSDPDA
jgi:hypothetical protein